MADLFDTLSLLVPEQVSASVIDAQLPDDDFIWSFIQNAPPITMAGRDTLAAPGANSAAGYFAEWRIKVQSGGSIEGASFGSAAVHVGAAGESLVGTALDDLYPDPLKAALPSHIPVRMSLKRFRGVMTLNKEHFWQKKLTTPFEDITVEYATDAIALIRHTTAAHAWGDGSAALARVDNAAGYPVTDNAPVAVAIKEGTPFRFRPGQSYVAGTYIAPASYSGSPRVARTGATSGTVGILRCLWANPTTRKVLFQAEPGTGTVTLSDGDVLMKYGYYNFGAANVNAGTKACEGIESLLINSGKFPGAINPSSGAEITDVTNHPYLMSFIAGDEAAVEVPTPELLAEMIDKMTDCGRKPPTTMVAEQSLWTYQSQIERSAIAMQIVPQAGAFMANGGVGGAIFSHGTMTFRKVASNLCRPGAVHGLTPESFRRFSPEGGNAVDWVLSSGGVAGAAGVFYLVQSGRQASKTLAAPYDFFFQLGCVDPLVNFRRIGLLSQRAANAA